MFRMLVAFRSYWGLHMRAGTWLKNYLTAETQQLRMAMLIKRFWRLLSGNMKSSSLQKWSCEGQIPKFQIRRNSIIWWVFGFSKFIFLYIFCFLSSVISIWRIFTLKVPFLWKQKYLLFLDLSLKSVRPKYLIDFLTNIWGERFLFTCFCPPKSKFSAKINIASEFEDVCSSDLD